MPTSPRTSTGQVLLSVPRHPVCKLKAPPTNITSSPEYSPNWHTISCGKMSMQRQSAHCKRCCIQKCLAEVFRFSPWQKMSILPHHWRVLNLAENHMGRQRAPRADFEKPLNPHPADIDHVFTTKMSPYVLSTMARNSDCSPGGTLNLSRVCLKSCVNATHSCSV